MTVSQSQSQSRTPDPGVAPAADPESVILGAEMAVRAIGRASRPQVLDRIRDDAKELADPLEALVETVPQWLGKRAAAGLREASEPTGRAALAGLADPRNFRELADGLSRVSRLGGHSARIVAGVLEPVMPGLRRLASFLLAVDLRGPAALSYQDGTARAADASLSVAQANELLSQLRSWHRVHAAAVRTQDLGRDVRVPVFGADHPHIPLELGPAQLLVDRVQPWEEASADPRLPDDLAAPLDVGRYVHVVLEPGVTDQQARAFERLVGAALRVLSTVLQHPFFQTLDDVTFVLHPQEASTAWLVPETGTVHVFSGPMGPYVLVHELAHLVDRRVATQGGFRSQEEGSPLHGFWKAARPLYEPVVRDRAGWYATGLLASACPDLPLLRSVPVEEAVATLRFVPEHERATVAELLVQGRATEWVEPGRPTTRAEKAVLTALQDGLLLEGEAVVVDPEVAHESLAELETERLLSPPEVVARYLDQYSRLLLGQRGLAFGPPARPSDLDPAELRGLASVFLDALLSEQQDYLERRVQRRGDAKLADTLVAGGVALAGAAVAAFFPKD